MYDVTSNRSKVYRIAMENFEKDLDSLLNSLLMLKEEHSENISNIKVDSPHESLWPKSNNGST